MKILFVAIIMLLTVPCAYCQIANGDVNCDGLRDIDDVVYMITYIFAQGPAPCVPPEPISIIVVSGDGQIGTTGEPLEEPFVVQVLDSSLTPIAGVPVVWSVIEGNGGFIGAETFSDGDGLCFAEYVVGNSLQIEIVGAHEFGQFIPSCEFSVSVPSPTNAMSFSGGRKRITVPDKAEFDFTQGITVEMWVLIEGLVATDNTLIGQEYSGDLAFKIDFRTYRIRAYKWSPYSGAVLSAETPIGVWFHVAFTYDSSGGVLYIDGIPQALCGFNGGIGNSQSPLILGDRISLVEAFEGNMDEVRLWNYARSQQDIQSGMSVELSGTEDGLVLYYRFNQWSGQDVVDMVTGSSTGYLGSSPEVDVNDPEFVHSTAPVSP